MGGWNAEARQHWPRRMERQTLATSLAEVESQVAGRQAKRGAQAGRGRQRRERSFALLLVGALTLFAVAIDGYHPCAEDGGLYMAGVKRLLDPRSTRTARPSCWSRCATPLRSHCRRRSAADPPQPASRSARVPSGQHLADALRRVDARRALLDQPPRAHRGRRSTGLLAGAPNCRNRAALHGPIRHRAQPLHSRNGPGAARRARHDSARQSVPSQREKDSAAFSSAPPALPSLLQCIP